MESVISGVFIPILFTCATVLVVIITIEIVKDFIKKK